MRTKADGMGMTCVGLVSAKITSSSNVVLQASAIMVRMGAISTVYSAAVADMALKALLWDDEPCSGITITFLSLCTSQTCDIRSKSQKKATNILVLW